MARTTSMNSRPPSFPIANADDDPFVLEDLQDLAAAVEAHDHSTGKGVAVSGGVIRYAEVVLSGTQASVTLPTSGSIPATHRNIRITGQARGNNAAAQGIQMRLNGDTTAIYDVQQHRGTATTSSAFAAMGQTSVGFGTIPGTAASAGAASAFEAVIPNYAATTFWKHFVSRAMRQDSTASGGSSSTRMAEAGAILRRLPQSHSFRSRAASSQAPCSPSTLSHDWLAHRPRALARSSARTSSTLTRPSIAIGDP